MPPLVCAGPSADMEASKLRGTIERSIQQPAELDKIVILRASAEDARRISTANASATKRVDLPRRQPQITFHVFILSRPTLRSALPVGSASPVHAPSADFPANLARLSRKAPGRSCCLGWPPVLCELPCPSSSAFPPCARSISISLKLPPRSCPRRLA